MHQALTEPVAQRFRLLAFNHLRHDRHIVALFERDACRRQLPAYMVPLHVDLRPEALPRNPNGKIDRPLLRAGFMNLFEE